MDAFQRLLQAQSPERIRVVVSRHWDNPLITVSVNQEKIVIEADIENFVDAIAAEIGPTWKVLTKKRLKARVREAARMAIEKIKEASSQVM